MSVRVNKPLRGKGAVELRTQALTEDLSREDVDSGHCTEWTVV